ncbi:hypothetical protein [Solidesulfovibrio carbinoliphilus]|uniref:hypothetical protein n=1 Tax=Solidesulfovibrio carbinoliphilus TaxID=345370 RepID=UPI0001C24193|nr:hypothetical protein [Solidesulfovibrio carbinoliphilus]
MKTVHPSFFTPQVQGNPATPLRPSKAGRLAAAVLALALGCLSPAAPPARADGGSGPMPDTYGPPPTLPPGSFDEDADEPPRRDIHMGNVDHMRMGRDEDGNTVMEIRPRPKGVEQQPQTGPIYVYPQVNLPGVSGIPATPMGGGSGRPGQPAGQPEQPGRQPGPPGQVPPAPPRPPLAGPANRPDRPRPVGEQPGQVLQPVQPGPPGQLPPREGPPGQGLTAPDQSLDGRPGANFQEGPVGRGLPQ